MSLTSRASLALALAVAGGFGLPGPPGVELIGLLVALGLGVWWKPASETREPTRFATGVELLGLALVLGLLARTLGRVVIASPASLWSLPVVAAALVGLALRPARGLALALTPAIVGIALAAAIFGANFEAQGPQPRGRVHGSPVLGVHPRQAIAVQIDGFGPHDIVVDDYVDPPGGQGYDPQRFAARLEAELHAIAERNYEAGPARARVAFANAEVEPREAIVPPADRELYESLLGFEVRSGTTGEGSTVEFVCPGQPLDPRGARANAAIGRSCPRKYLIDGSTGLGLASRFPGYTEVIGRDRARVAQLLGWPSGDARDDRRTLALESGIWLLGLVSLAWLLARGRRRDQPPWAEALASASVLGALLVIALLGPPGEDSLRGGPTLLAILLILIPTQAPDPPRREAAGLPSGLPSGLPFALLVALLAASPLGGHGDALELLANTRDRMVDLGVDWAIASALAGSSCVVVLAVGVGIGATALVDRCRAAMPREGRHMRADLLALGLALTLAVGLALRKPADDLPLLASAAAVLTLALGRPRSRAQLLALALATTLAAAAPLLEGEVASPISQGLVAVGAMLCLALGLTSIASSTRRTRA